MTDDTTPTTAAPAGHGVLVRARNGDIISYDSSGVILRLSDKVIDDIALRLGGRVHVGHAGVQDKNAPPPEDMETLEAMLDGLDVWSIRAEDEWLRFSGRLPGRQGVRDYRRSRMGGDVIADAPGALMGILGIGGPRAALANPGKAGFPFHILSPDDDIGAVGHAGMERAAPNDYLAPLREMTHEALMAEACLDWQMDKHAGLPVFVTRVETDSATDAAALARGMAFDNLMTAAASLKRAAARLGKPARLFAVTLDFTLEALDGSAADYRDGMLDLMARIEEGVQKLGFERPVFVARIEAGRPGLISDRLIDAQWELAWNFGDHRLAISAPSYMFAHDEYDRPTSEARCHMAEMSSAAVSAVSMQRLQTDPMRDGWRCPVIHLAELEPETDGRVTLRVVTRAHGDLVLAAPNAPGGDRGVGFTLEGDDTGASITAVTVDPDDRQTLLLTLDRRPEGEDLRLRYGYGTPPSGPGAVALRDDWHLASRSGRDLHRWALPCRVPVWDGGLAS